MISGLKFFLYALVLKVGGSGSVCTQQHFAALALSAAPRSVEEGLGGKKNGASSKLPGRAHLPKLPDEAGLRVRVRAVYLQHVLITSGNYSFLLPVYTV